MNSGALLSILKPVILGYYSIKFMGLTISFENDMISKSIKTGHFLDILERLEVQMPRTLESQV